LPQGQLVCLPLVIASRTLVIKIHDSFLAARYAAVATKEVILSAGAYNTPALLQLSGIGDPAHLGPLGIHTRVVRRDVGKNLQDHPLFVMSWSVNTTDTADPIFRGDPVAATADKQWALNHTGKFRHSIFYCVLNRPPPCCHDIVGPGPVSAIALLADKVFMILEFCEAE